MQRIIVLSLLVLFMTWPANAESTMKIGVVDGEKLFDNYPGVDDAQKRITDAQDALRNAIEESEKIFGEFEKQKKSEAEKLTKKKELQSNIDTKAKETKEVIESISVKIEDDILQAINKIAKQRGFDVVFDKRAVLTGGIDATDEVTKILSKVPLANGSSEADPEKEKKKTN